MLLRFIANIALYAAGFPVHCVDSLPSSRAYKLGHCKSQALSLLLLLLLLL